MAIVERTTTSTRRPGDTTVTETSDSGTGILVVLAIIVALAAAYFAYDYYAAPADETLPMATTTDTVNQPAGSSFDRSTVDDRTPAAGTVAPMERNTAIDNNGPVAQSADEGTTSSTVVGE